MVSKLVRTPPPQAAGTTESQSRVGNRKRPEAAASAKGSAKSPHCFTERPVRPISRLPSDDGGRMEKHSLLDGLDGRPFIANVGRSGGSIRGGVIDPPRPRRRRPPSPFDTARDPSPPPPSSSIAPSSSRPPVDVFDVFDVVVPLARREENAADGRYLRTMSRTIRGQKWWPKRRPSSAAAANKIQLADNISKKNNVACNIF